MHSDREWKYWGEEDPLWAVASRAGKRQKEPGAWTEAEFMAVGVEDWSPIVRQWEHYGLGSPQGRGRVIEIGCGAGRMTKQLLTRFERVLAIDVAPAMVELAKRLLGPDADRVDFCLVDRPAVPAESDSCDGAFSTHVFQHFSDLNAVHSYLTLTHRALAPGASVCFHFPISGAPRKVPKPRPLVLRRVAQWLRRAVGRLDIIEYSCFDPDAVFRALERAGFRDIELRAFDVPAGGDSHAFFFGRRSQLHPRLP